MKMAFNCYMHPRNIYKVRPDFRQLASEFPEFSEYAVCDERGRVHVNFKDANTLRCLTRTLLKKDFGLKVSIPENCLIPTVPQRLNYILWIEDLLNALPDTGNGIVKGIDIGTGPCCIFALLGAKKNGWQFLATESEEDSIKWATQNIVENELLEQVDIHKVDKDVILKGAVDNKEQNFDFCMCNPPFFHDLDEMHQRKKVEGENLKVKQSEVMVQGGEVEFIKKMIRDSVELKEKIKVYTSMFGKKKSLVEIKNDLKNLGSVNFTFTEFCQGNTMRWGVAWTFMKGVHLNQVHCSKRKKKKKPMNFLIPKTVKGYSIKNMLPQVVSILQELSIQHEIKKETRLNVVLLIKSNENTWSHQRRKRRQAQQLAKMSSCADSECKANETVPDDSEVSVVTCDITENISDSCAVEKSKKDDSVDTSEYFQADFVANAAGIVNVGVKRKYEQENEDSSVKHVKMNSNETQKSSLDVAVSSETEVPLLCCDLELKRHCDKIMLEMSCEEHCNRQSMSEMLQLLKNRLK